MSASNVKVSDNMETKDLERLNRPASKTTSVPGTTMDAVFGEMTEDGPNYRGVS